ncbi:PREDICTED: interferon alpha/beta receptor 2-like [Thamnophis sirtalis]|uniref:Interferon alpha/beta receptor 2-like n=1 Tax=Thamnophis sirtalis TaxID=35019 RepID=A0A6I9YI19_9SAUR|nr:PREDICTED: interferon alpha/beta receptor 2-like [Thamnophis sirtalis]XP_013923855.1 PREDICTED: interferon alpha/beta receptor 2-like [Thamnophis sirtalis]
MAFSMKPLNFCKLAYISAITLSFSNFLETSESSLILNMKAEDFEYILSWKAGNSSRIPVCYTVIYWYNMKSDFDCNLHTMETKSKSAVKSQEQVNSYNSRSPENQDSDHHVLGPGQFAACPPMKQALSDIKSMQPRNVLIDAVQGCTNIARPFCNLTNEFADVCRRTAYIVVQQYTSNGTNYSDIIPFNPFSNRCFRPPQFNISVCQNCVNVTVKLPPLLLKIYQKLDYTIIVETADLKENRVTNSTKQDNFFTILEDLHANKNYCIAVQVSTGHNPQCTSTIPKCIMLESNNREDYIMLSILAPLILVVVIIISAFLYKAGFIFFKRSTSSNVLNINRDLAYSVFESNPEEICEVQVQESEAQQHSDDENSESDVESNLDTECDFFNQITPFSQVENTQKLFTGCSATKNEVTRTLAQRNQDDIDKSSPITPLYPSEVNSGHVAESERTDCLNVNLNSVMLGISDKNLDFSTIDHEDLNESCILDAFEPNHFTEMPDNQSFDVQNLCSWENRSVSGESESSYSETECTSGYMKR